MKGKQKKTVVKIAVGLISVLGMTAIDVGSTFAGANKEYQPVNYVKCQAYSDINYQDYVGYESTSNRQCNDRVKRNYKGYYWLNAGQ